MARKRTGNLVQKPSGWYARVWITREGVTRREFVCLETQDKTIAKRKLAKIVKMLAAGELVADQLPSTPSRTKPPGLIARILLGGLSGAGVAAAGMQPMALGAFLGIAGGLVGTYGGYQARTRLVRALKVPDFVIAFLEDAAAIGGGLFIVSRF